MKHVGTVASGTGFAGWRIIRSNAGRLWASREQPFPVAAERAGAYRTVDADDLMELCQVIGQQEAIAEQVAASAGLERTARSASRAVQEGVVKPAATA
ncbi:hypothetical protein ACQP1K_08435 [Sphaerimonospora sp. CA-214678]|uniref:hypothetical protein n=1 Tax=Sphaerimonospora sp. CA-214678 TaxID=3240029 RepID=UPI003D939F1D